MDTINQIIDEANLFHPSIKLVHQLVRSVSFLHVYIENKSGLLTTSVFDEEAAEPYIVPSKSDHPWHVSKNVIDGALMGAVRYSSTLMTFNEERRSIIFRLLYNG